MYLANTNIGTPGTDPDVIYVSNGTEDTYKGQLKVESRSTLIDLAQGQLLGWHLNVDWGAGVSNTPPILNVVGTGAGSSEIINSDFTLNYYSPGAFSTKPLFNASLTGSMATLSNVNIWIDQTFAQYSNTVWPAWALVSGVTNNSWVYLVGSSYPVLPAAMPTLSTISFFYNNGASSASCTATSWVNATPTWDGTSTVTFPASSSLNSGSITCTTVDNGVVTQYYPSTGGSPQTVSMATQFFQSGGHWWQQNGYSFNVSGVSWIVQAGTPSGSCVSGSILSNTSGGSGTTLYTCVSGSWVDIK
jgi:hypothetical protein